MEKEYKIIQGSASECQKILNQWRHQYQIVVLEMTAHITKMTGFHTLSILVIRSPKIKDIGK